MRRAITPILLAVAMLSAGATNASAFGLFGHHFGGCDTAPACEPACGCEVAPACGCEIAPACGCEAVDPCCAPKRPVRDFFNHLFHKNNSCCDVAPVCEPACGLEIAPSCGYEVAPACGCEAPACGGHHRGGLLQKLFSHKHGCDSCCDVAPACEPACGCEVAAPSCGCGF